MNVHDIEVFEGVEDACDLDQAIAIQRAINSGSAWSFQGSYGRTMMAALEEGICLLGREPARDYYGNRIPSRDEVKEGTKGSYEYVVNALGASWAEKLAAV